jgi:hypothetical protein
VKKVSKTQIAEDRAVIKAISELPDYRPANPACSIEALLQLDATLQAAESSTQQVRNERARIDRALGQMVDVESGTGAMLHDLVMTAKLQVAAQYGQDSYAVTTIGWTRKSDRKRPARKAAE